MATITSAQTGLASATSTWVGGVVPVEGDQVIVASGHIITLDGNYTWGNDSITETNAAAAIVVKGTIKASRAVSSSLTCKGIIYLDNTGGTLDFGTLSDRIPANITADLILNKAVTPSFRYGVATNNIAANGQYYKILFAGTSNRTRYVHLNTDVAASATSLSLVNSTHGWVIGDKIMLLSTTLNTNNDESELVTITSVSGASIGFTPAVVYSHRKGMPVGNFNSNVTIRPYNEVDAQQSGIKFQGNITYTSTYEVKFYDVCFRNIGRASNVTAIQATGSANKATEPYVFVDCAYLSTIFAASFAYSGQVWNLYVKNFVSWTGLNGFNAIPMELDGFCIRGSLRPSAGSVIKNGYVAFSKNNSGLTGSATVDNVVFSGNSAGFIQPDFNGTPKIVVKNSDLGYTYGYRTSFAGDYLMRISGSYDWNAFIEAEFTDCMIESTYAAVVADIATLSRQKYVNVSYINKNKDVTQQEVWKETGKFIRENAISYSSTSSIKLIPNNTAVNQSRPLSRTITIGVDNNETVTLVGYVRMDATYYNSGVCYMPTATLSGLNITPVVFTASVGADQWQKFTLTATNTIGYPGNLTLTLTAQLNTLTGGNVYFDGLIDLPFIVTARHYGYIFEEGNIKRTIDAYIQQVDASIVGSYSGIAINHVTQTITLTANHSIQELYDYCKWTMCQTQNLTKSDILTTRDGTNYICTYNLTIDGATLSGPTTTSVNLPTKTYTKLNDGSSSLRIVDINGEIVTRTFAVSNIVSGSEVRLYRASDMTELSGIETLSGSAFQYTYVYSVDVPAILVVFSLGYNPIYLNVTLSNNNTSIPIQQTIDRTYSNN